jgi:hypothetical protein
VQRLEKLPGWYWEGKKISPRGSIFWEEAYEKLIEYQKLEGHVQVPQHYVTVEGFRLGNWVKYQRKTRSNISLDRRSRLEDLECARERADCLGICDASSA